jgi:hypothetical protein
MPWIVVVAPRPVNPAVWTFRRGSKMWIGSVAPDQTLSWKGVTSMSRTLAD